MEEWRAIPGYEGYYEVSNLGNVRSLDRVLVYKNGVATRTKGRLLKQERDVDGYLRVTLSRNYKSHRRKVHKFVALAFLGPPLNELQQINHKNSQRDDNRVDNIEWATPQQNGRHAVEIGLRSGTANPRMAKKLTADIARCIVRDYVAGGGSISKISSLYNVEKTTARRIIRGKLWRKATEGLRPPHDYTFRSRKDAHRAHNGPETGDSAPGR